jgi:hypothetical protein
VPLKELESWLKRGQNVPFLREICSPKECIPKIGANIGAITGILLREDPLSPGNLDVFFQKYRIMCLSICKSKVNSFQAIALLTGQKKEVLFLRGHISLKMGCFAPFLSTIQALSSTRVFLLGENERKLLCTCRTFTGNKPLPLYLGPKQLNFQLGIEPGK